MADLDDFLGGEALSLGSLSRDAQGLSDAFAAELSEVREEMKRTSAEADRLSSSISGSLRRALDGLVFGGKRASETLRGLGRDLSNNVLNAALGPIQKAVGSGISGLVSSGVGSVLGGLNLFADGAAFSAGRVRAFAGGGVVEGPTLFPMRGGTGLMGEAGPEAILPLTRGPDGRLGVASAGGGGTHVTVNVHTRDAQSFLKSRGQVAAAISRAANAGTRQL
ncbi:phage tail tape measure protein [Rhodovulum sp. DZ06]|uniref:phage tail tape measure protein n=1 Tax=Rhodovulum sp. DZ06 TaxID=3425126 RepID=UPI003D331488